MNHLKGNQQSLHAESEKLTLLHTEQLKEVEKLQAKISDLNTKLANANDLPHKIKDEEDNLERISANDKASSIKNLEVSKLLIKDYFLKFETV
jgi:hypothetical protein